jgi:hypothetical protein
MKGEGSTALPKDGEPSSASPSVPSLRQFRLFLVLDVVCPYLTYQYLQHYHPEVSQSLALVLSGVFPVLANLISIARSRSLDIIGVMVLLGIIVGAVSVVVGGNPRLVLVRESFVTGALAIVCLVSLFATPRLLLFYIGRDFSTGHDPARIAEFNALWYLPDAPRAFRVMTAAWGVGWIVEVALKVLIVFNLSIPQAFVFGPIQSAVITVLLILWTVRYARTGRRRREEATRTGIPVAPRLI